MYRKPFLFGIRGPANNSYTSPSALFAEARFLSGHCRHANTRAELGRSGQPWAWWHSAMTAARGSAHLLAYLCCFPGSTSRAGRPRPVSCQRWWELPARAGCRPPSPQGNDAAPSWGQRGGWQGSCRSYPLETRSKAGFGSCWERKLRGKKLDFCSLFCWPNSVSSCMTRPSSILQLLPVHRHPFDPCDMRLI